MFKGLLLLTCTLLVVIGTSESQDGVYGIATFNMRGIRGTIKFIPNKNNNNTNITVNIRGTNMVHHWHIHYFPVDTSLPPQLRCSANLVGNHFDPLGAKAKLGSLYSTYCNPNNKTECEVGDLGKKFGHLMTGTSNHIDDSGQLTLFGQNGIIGRSVKIHGTQDVCTTIYSSTEVMNRNIQVTTLQASFVYPIGGTIYMRQVAGEEATIFGKLYWVTNSANSTGHPWHIHTDQPGMRYREAVCEVGSIFAAGSNLVGDLSSRHGNLDIADKPDNYSDYAFFFHDNQLNLTGVNAVMGRSVMVHRLDDGRPLACAPLVKVEDLTISVSSKKFSASQSSRFGYTSVNTSYSASDIVIFNSAIAPNQLCQKAFSAGQSKIYNPHGVPSLDGSDDTPDRYSVGDFKRKYNFTTTGQNRVSELPIKGTETIAGHSMGYSKQNSSGTHYICSTLWPRYPTGASVKMAKAKFNNTVKGAIYFIQRNFGNGVFGTTYVFVDIWYNNSKATPTSNHLWHVHTNPPVSGQTCTNSIGNIFNPFSVYVEPSVTSECSQYAQLRCRSGDLSGKHGQIQISPPSASRSSVTYTDNNLHLWGTANYSIIGRSIGLHQPSQGTPLMDCAEIVEVFKASTPANISIPYNANFERTNFTQNISNNIMGSSPDDILIIRQQMTMDRSSQTGKVDMTVQVLGTSVEDANTKSATLQSMYSGVGMILPSISVICLLILVLVFGQF